MIRAIDLCAGAGGWACAARGLPIEFVAIADQVGDCLETWVLNHQAAHPGCKVLQVDLTTNAGIEAVRKACKLSRRKASVDLVLGAIPCEQVSCARANRKLKEGEMEVVHALIDQCFGLVKHLRPRWWCFEDAEGIIPHLPVPLDAGCPNYEVRKINAAGYGPQSRERVFFGSYPWPIAQPQPGPRTLGEVLRPGPYRTLPQLRKYKRSKSKWYGGDQCRVQEPSHAGKTVISSHGSCGRAERGGLVPVSAQARNLDSDAPAPTVTESYRCDERTVPLARVQDASQPCPTVADYGGRHERAALVPADPTEELVRVLEWQEAAILQGFPSDYVFAASWSRTWKLVAQAIPIQVGKAILKAIVAEWQKT